MGRSEAGLTAACTDLKRWQGSGVWLPVLWRQQSWPQERLQINQLRMVRLLNHNLSSKEVTFKSLNKLGNSEKLYQERLYSKDQRKNKASRKNKSKGKKGRKVKGRKNKKARKQSKGKKGRKVKGRKNKKARKQSKSRKQGKGKRKGGKAGR